MLFQCKPISDWYSALFVSSLFSLKTTTTQRDIRQNFQKKVPRKFTAQIKTLTNFVLFLAICVRHLISLLCMFHWIDHILYWSINFQNWSFLLIIFIIDQFIIDHFCPNQQLVTKIPQTSFWNSFWLTLEAPANDQTT